MGDITKYNDNELIYLIKNNNEEAYHFLIEKYSLLIYSRISFYEIANVEDSYQEGLICLFKAVNKFDEKYNKTFNKFFLQALNNRLIDIKHQEVSYYNIIVDSDYVNKCVYLKEDIDKFNDYTLDEVTKKIKPKLKDIELSIYEDYFINNISPKDLSIKYNLTIISIYHIIYRIRRKIKKYVVK